MISIEELNSIKEKRKTNLYYEEKEYLQYVFLSKISNYNKDFVFKGGTCLRICYDLERASEDLDFNSNLSTDKTKEVVRTCLKNFEYLNISYEIYSEKEYEGNIRMEVRFKGPLFTGRPHTTNTLKIDFNKKKVAHTAVKVVQKMFSDVPLFTIVVLDEKEIFAEKMRALISRKESRDLYDVWILFNKKVEFDKKLILEKLRDEKVKVPNSFVLPVKEKYEQDLRELVKNLPSYEQVKKEVLLMLEKLK